MCIRDSACTKELLSWVLSESLEIDFVLETVKQLIEKHGTDLSMENLKKLNRLIRKEKFKRLFKK